MPDSLKLIADLAADDLAKRRQAAEQLSQLGPAASPAAVVLVQCAADPDEEVREFVVAALEDMGPPAQDDMDELMTLLGHESPDVGYWAATLLGRLGKVAAPAVPSLISALTGGSNLAVRQRAAWALGKIGHPAAKALDALQTAATATDNPRLAKLAQQAIEQIKR